MSSGIACDRRRFLQGSAALAAVATVPARAAAGDLTRLSLAEASDLVRRRALSPVDLTQACLARIERYEPRVNAFITLTPEIALAQARVAEAEIARGTWRGALHGIPLALKDNIDTQGIRTTAASGIYAARVPTQDATVVTRLKDGGAVLLGKLNMGEFAMSESVVSHWGAVHNPWALDRETGGSSSGAGAAIAADFCFGAIGTDTAGSIRMPASHCGVVGFKPSYGLVSNRNVIPLIESMDHVGPLAKTVGDAALLLQALAGHDPDWSDSVSTPAVEYAMASRGAVDALRIGVARDPFLYGADAEIVSAFEVALTVLRGVTSVVRDVASPAVDIDMLAMFAAETTAYHRPLQAAHALDYEPSNRHKFTGPSAEDGWAMAAKYVDARQALLAARRSIAGFFIDLDLIVLPTMRYLPRRNDVLLEEVNRGVAIGGSNTRPFDILGLPAISIPMGFSNAGLPIGLQIVGAPLADASVLRLARAFEAATSWHQRRPRFLASSKTPADPAGSPPQLVSAP